MEGGGTGDPSEKMGSQPYVCLGRGFPKKFPRSRRDSDRLTDATSGCPPPAPHPLLQPRGQAWASIHTILSSDTVKSLQLPLQGACILFPRQQGMSVDADHGRGTLKTQTLFSAKRPPVGLGWTLTIYVGCPGASQRVVQCLCHVENSPNLEA